MQSKLPLHSTISPRLSLLLTTCIATGIDHLAKVIFGLRHHTPALLAVHIPRGREIGEILRK
jgi:hypothetical protein